MILQCLLGDKYGSRLLPHYVNASEYKLLRRIAMRRGYDISIMDEWFERDDNAEPPVYRLRSINEILSHYDDHDNEALQSKVRRSHSQEAGKFIITVAECLIKSNILLLFPFLYPSQPMFWGT